MPERLPKNRDGPGELIPTGRLQDAGVVLAHPIARSPEALRKFILRKGGTTVVLLGLCFCLMMAAALDVPRADWGFTVSVFALLRKLLAKSAV